MKQSCTNGWVMTKQVNVRKQQEELIARGKEPVKKSMTRDTKLILDRGAALMTYI